MPHRPDQQQRGFSPVYRANEVNHCPGCGRTHWYVGRLSAECGFCATALLIADSRMAGLGGHSRNRRPVEIEAWAA